MNEDDMKNACTGAGRNNSDGSRKPTDDSEDFTDPRAGEGRGAGGGQARPGRRWRRGEALLGRYVVEGELGEGGMGVVSPRPRRRLRAAVVAALLAAALAVGGAVLNLAGKAPKRPDKEKAELAQKQELEEAQARFEKEKAAEAARRELAQKQEEARLEKEKAAEAARRELAQKQEEEQARKQAEQEKVKVVTLPGGVKLKLVKIPAGAFMMGSPEGEKERSPVESRHRVTLTRDFWLGEWEVTQAQYEAVMKKNPSSFTKGGNYPVNCVSWGAAMEFCGKLTERERSAGRLPEGYVYTLPTEAEWEYACRAGTETPFHFGASLNGREANCDGNYPYGTAAKGPYRKDTAECGSYSPNAWGLYDMHGNVWEWCWDWLDMYGGDAEDPGGPETGSYRVCRGGSWGSSARYCRAAYRDLNGPSSRSINLGFRVALAPSSLRAGLRR